MLALSSSFSVDETSSVADADLAQLEDIRERFQAEVTRRWSRTAAEIKRAIVQHDILGVSDKAPWTVQPAGDRAHLFQRWLNERLAVGIGGYDGSWLEPFVRKASERGAQRAVMGDAAQTNLGFMLPAGAPPSARVCHQASAAALGSICADVSQRAHDSVARGLLSRERQARIGRSVDEAMGYGLKRSRALAEHAVSMSFSQGALDGFEAAGISHVGTLSERAQRKALHGWANRGRAQPGEAGQGPARQGAPRHGMDGGAANDDAAAAADWFADAARKTPQPKHPRHGRFVTHAVHARELRRSKRTGRFRKQGLSPEEQRLEELREARFGRVKGRLDVETAGDDRVCFPSGTMVRTSEGDKPIQHVRVGDEVLTRAGLKKIIETGKRRYRGRLLLISAMMVDLERVAVSLPPMQMHAAESSRLIRSLAIWDRARGALARSVFCASVLQETAIMKLAQSLGLLGSVAIRHGAWRLWNQRSSNAASFVCTADHPVWCERGGFVPAHELLVGDMLQLVGDRRAEVDCIVDLGFSDMRDRPARSFQKLLATGARSAMPISSVNLQRGAVQSEVDDVSSCLKLLNERDVQLVERAANSSLDGGFAREFAVAGAGAEPRRRHRCWRDSLRLTAVGAGEYVGRAAAFLGAMSPVEVARDVGRFVPERFAASFASFGDMAHRGALADHRAEIVAAGGGGIDDKRSLALGAEFRRSGCVGHAARERTADCAAAVRPVWRDMIKGGVAGLASLVARRFYSWHSTTVYNLTVEGKPEFFANGVLVHNCDICDGISSNGPYSINEARSLIPAHPRCRCVFVAAGQMQRDSHQGDEPWPIPSPLIS